MIDSLKFSNKINQILEFYQISASQFAESISVPRSTISHITSGRNKPSLEFVMRIVNKYSDVTLDWLVSDKGVFPKKIEEKIPVQPKAASPTLFSDNKNETEVIQKEKNNPKVNSSEVERIVIFYKNGTFKEYLSD